MDQRLADPNASTTSLHRNRGHRAAGPASSLSQRQGRQPRGGGMASTYTAARAHPPADDVHLLIRSSNSVVIVPPSEIRHRPSPPTTTEDAESRSAPDTPSDASPHCPGGSRTPAAIIVAPLHLCEAYADRGLCPAGVACPDVHAALTPDMPRYRPHFRAAAGNEATPRLGLPGEWHPIAAGNKKVATLRVEASQCLLTKVSARLRATVRCDPPSVCAHFVTKSVCNFGAECRFVHPLSQPLPLGIAPPHAVVHGDAAPAGSLHSGAADEYPAPTAPNGGGRGSRRTRRRFWHNPYGALPGWFGDGGTAS